MNLDKILKTRSGSKASTSKKAKPSNMSKDDPISVIGNEGYPENNDEQQPILPSTFIDFPSLFLEFYDFLMLSPNPIQYSPFFYQFEFYNNINNDNINAAEQMSYTDYGFET